MKLTIKLAAMAIILCLSAPAGAQFNITIVNTNEVTKAEPVDDLLFTVQYETTFVPDTLKPERTFSETMMLKIGKKNSVYYSYAKFLTDSVIEVDKKNGADIEVIKSHLQQYSSKINYKVHKNYPPGKLTFLDQLGPNRFRNEETTVVPRWTLLPDTMTVASYLCQKATCHLYGRTYEAWYTTDIPRSDGPWKLQGLPGLILKARDTRDHYTFQCTRLNSSHR